eukprot:3899989-Alexandrium_andersonii.AAC.1
MPVDLPPPCLCNCLISSSLTRRSASVFRTIASGNAAARSAAVKDDRSRLRHDAKCVPQLGGAG